MNKKVCAVLICLVLLAFLPVFQAAPEEAGEEDLLKDMRDQDILRPQPQPMPVEEPRRARQGGYYTPYSPPDPATLNPQLQVHIIQNGDTLWGIAEIYLGDGLMWPQIWEVNKYITDAHWIYPGDPVIIPQPLMVAEIEEEIPGPSKLDLIRQAEPIPMATATDVNCSFFIKKVSRRTKKLIDPIGFAKIIGGEDPRVGWSVGDVVYINRGEADGVIPGDEFMIIRKGDLVNHPITEKLMGRKMDMVGRMIVLAAQTKTSTARISNACDVATLGEILVPYSQIPIPLASGYMRTSKYWTESSGKRQGYVITTKDGVVTAAEGMLVGIDVGSADGIVPGDFFTIFRANPVGKELPRKILGDLVVLTVEDETATSKIISAYYPIWKGDRIELK
ncbi:LysM peptidoglycan-binding domain-containing protein [Acidobacteriota bacterium]